MSKSLLYFNVAFVDISQTLYDSGLNSRRGIFLVVLSSAIACLLVCLFVCLFANLCFESLFVCMVSDDAGLGICLLMRWAVPQWAVPRCAVPRWAVPDALCRDGLCRMRCAVMGCAGCAVP